MRDKLQGLGGIFIPHFERSEIVAGPPAEPSQFGSDIFKQTPPFDSPACRQARSSSSTTPLESNALSEHRALKGILLSAGAF